MSARRAQFVIYFGANCVFLAPPRRGGGEGGQSTGSVRCNADARPASPSVRSLGSARGMRRARVTSCSLFRRPSGSGSWSHSRSPLSLSPLSSLLYLPTLLPLYLSLSLCFLLSRSCSRHHPIFACFTFHQRQNKKTAAFIILFCLRPPAARPVVSPPSLARSGSHPRRALIMVGGAGGGATGGAQ